MAGYYTYASEIFNLTPENSDIQNVVVFFEEVKIFFEINGKSNSLETIDIYPNPSSDIINANLPDNTSNIHIRLYERSGIEVSNHISEISVENNVISIDISNLNSGLYFGKIVCSKETYPIKFYKK